MLEKKQLRAKINVERTALVRSSWKNWSKSIEQRLFDNEHFKIAQAIHCFVSMNHRNEVDTHQIINKCLIDNKTIYVPVMDETKNELQHAQITSFEELTENDWGVLEPSLNAIVSPINPDIILVPLLAANKNGNRLGYGKGYYDRFLANTKAIKIGLVFDQFIIDHVPVDSHDIPLDLLISETRTINV